MVKNNGCCDLIYAQELKELGFKQESIWWWVSVRKGEPELYHIQSLGMLEINSPYAYKRICSAPTGTELGEALPPIYPCQRKHSSSIGRGEWHCADNTDMVHFFADTEANARARILIWAIKKKRVSV